MTKQPDTDAHKNTDSSDEDSPPPTMATVAQRNTPFTLPHIGFRDQRPTLPPLTDLAYHIDRHTTSPLTTPPISRIFEPLDPFSRPNFNQTSPANVRNFSTDPRYTPSSFHGAQQTNDSNDPFWRNPLKRSFDSMARDPSRHSQITSSPVPSGHSLSGYSEPWVNAPTGNNGYMPASSRSSYSDASTPSQAQSIMSFMGQGSAQEARAVSARAGTSRLSLYIRQQPRAARAGPDGKDRRPIDPPPILQLMIDDFDIDNDDDVNELRSTYFVVFCRLISATMPRKDLSTTQTLNEDGTVDIQRLLLGNAVASPFICKDDPDPAHMPTHPVTSAVERPPSPSSRFIQSRSQARDEERPERPERPETLPASFFIFPDLSIRKAGEYRLEFSLMKIEANSMVAGKNLPIVHTVHSQVFKVVNAKDFDQVQPSTALVKGLLDRGAGFPLKLKKGIREGQRRRQNLDESDDDDDDDEEGA